MRDPFDITEPTCISFSGGRSSAYMLWRVLQANGGLPKDAFVCFANTGKEEEATLRFVQRCAAEWDIPITWLEFEDTETGFRTVDFASASRGGRALRGHHPQAQLSPESCGPVLHCGAQDHAGARIPEIAGLEGLAEHGRHPR